MKVIQLFKNESQLIQRAAQNNREAQQKLYEIHSGKMQLLGRAARTCPAKLKIRSQWAKGARESMRPVLSKTNKANPAAKAR